MFKMTKKELELIKNICKHLLIEKGMREAISYIVKKYIKPNKKYMTDYDSSKKKYIYCLFRFKKFKWLGNGSIFT